MKPRVGIVGPLLGGNEGWVVSQGEILARHLEDEGYTVLGTSRHPGRLRRLADTIWSLWRWRRRVDVVVVMVFSGVGFMMAEAAALTAAVLRMPVVLHLHGGNLPAFADAHPRRVRSLLRRGRRVVAPSGFLQSELGRFGTEIAVIPNIVPVADVPYTHRTRARRRLLWMRTFHPHYNAVMAVDVVDRLRRTHPDIRLTMAGQEKGTGPQVQARIAELGLENHVCLAGFLDPAGKERAFAEHDVYLNTNHIDNTPVSVIEAASAGLAVVATRVGGIPHLLEDERSALLVPDGDAEAMAAAVDRLLGDDELVARLSAEGHRLAERSQWPAVRTQWDTVLAEATTG